MAKSKFGLLNEEFAVTKAARKAAPDIDSAASDSSEKVVLMSFDQLKLDTENALIYCEDTDETVKFLSDDIKANGFKGAILAYPTENGQYQIESGHRRFLAAKMAGIKQVPVMITETPKTDSERKIRLISMNLHSRESLKPTVMAKVIDTLIESNREEQMRSGLSTDMATLHQMVANQCELSVKSIEKYKMIPRLIKPLQDYADEGLSWSALIQCATLPEEKQIAISFSLKSEIERVGIENVSRQWIINLTNKIRQEIIGEPIKAKTTLKRRDGAKIIEKCSRDFNDILSGNVMIKEKDKANVLLQLKSIRECIDQKIEELSK